MDAISKHSCVIIIGETGSGKTTQIPQFLNQAGYSKNGMIAITQPRRVAAISIANRVSQEMKTKLGQQVGYSIRFEDCTSNKTIIKYMTDGMLLRELVSDRNLSRYSVIILDEAHERTLRTDILFGLVKSIQKHRRDLKIIVMSATINPTKFSNYFMNSIVVNVKGRQFPVTINHAKEIQEDYLDSAIVSIFQIHQEEPEGDILVFLTGQEEIENAERIINEESPNLPPVILSTNIAETSITISGVKYVVDTGVSKVRSFNPLIGIESLEIKPISKASAFQRSGRAGRESSGSCYRLYTIDSFSQLDEETEPEIKRVNLANVILQLKARYNKSQSSIISGVEDVASFDYLDKPTKASLTKALVELYALGALSDDGSLSPLGTQMSNFPLDPPFSKIIITSKALKCVRRTIDIISILSIDSLFFIPHDKRQEANASLKKFINYQGDHLTYLNVLDSYIAENASDEWCTENFIKKRSMKHVLDTRKQLLEYSKRLNLYDPDEPIVSVSSDWETLIKCFLSGFFMNTATLQPDGSYKTLGTHQIVYIHPSSYLFGRKAQYVFFNELVKTTKRYMRKVSMIEIEWLYQIAPHYFNQTRILSDK